MRRYLAMLCAMVTCIGAMADTRPILLVTPQGVYQSEVVDGVPGAWKPASIDVIVQGFGGGGNTPIPPDPPASDPQVLKIASLAKSLKDQPEATAVAAVINSLAKLGLSGTDFVQALEMAAPITDKSLQADGRVTAFVKSSLEVTNSAEKMVAGLKSAWGIEGATLDTAHSAATRPEGSELPPEAAALDLAAIITIIQMIIQLLKNLGIIP